MGDIGEKLPLKFKSVRDAFRPLDLSRNGKITRTEMRSFLRGFAWPREVADRFFSVLDEDGSVRLISMTSWHTLMSCSDLQTALRSVATWSRWHRISSDRR